MTCAALPIAASRVTSGYGWRNRPSGPDLHTGIDLGAPEGSPVRSMLPGRVVVSAPNGALSGYGQTVVIEHGPRLFSLSAHLQARTVTVGQSVAAGQQIGTVGRTAGTKANPGAVFATSGPHLHLEFLDAWPPAGRDLNRLDVGQVLGAFGVIVPPSGPLALACSNGAQPSWPVAPGAWPIARQNSQPSPMVTPAASTTSQGGALVAFAFLAIAAFLGSK